MNETEHPKQKFTGYWIPVELSYLGLSKIEQMLLSVIDSLDAPSPDFCFASNKFLAEQMDLSESRISFYLTKFKRMKLIKEVAFDGRRRRMTCLKENWYKKNIENETESSKKELCVKTRSQGARKHEARVRENTNHITKSISEVKKDNVSRKKTMPRSTDQDKTLDAQRRWKLTDDQYQNLLYLQDNGVNSDEGTLAHWVKTYPFERLYDVLNHAKSKKPDNLGAYMQKLFKTDAIVENNTIKSNAAFAKDFAKAHGWNQLKVLGKYCTFPMNGTDIEIPLSLRNEDFINMLIEKFEIFTK